MSKENSEQIKIAMQHVEMYWDTINTRIQTFNQSVEQATTKDMKKIEKEASLLINDLGESEKLLQMCVDRLNEL